MDTSAFMYNLKIENKKSQITYKEEYKAENIILVLLRLYGDQFIIKIEKYIKHKIIRWTRKQNPILFFFIVIIITFILYFIFIFIFKI